jgi:preprotein translocase subunit SecG
MILKVMLLENSKGTGHGPFKIQRGFIYMIQRLSSIVSVLFICCLHLFKWTVLKERNQRSNPTFH